jgi:hypothetical protein
VLALFRRERTLTERVGVREALTRHGGKNEVKVHA